MHECKDNDRVSTLSRPKAADIHTSSDNTTSRFNTQPPEGGCRRYQIAYDALQVSTLSRPKAAEIAPQDNLYKQRFQHSAARRRLLLALAGAGVEVAVSTLSRPKAAGGSPVD